ncbi:12695_t:CDS:2 [Racocetra fulgida]|uniref:12694_t:CDS:1 n=1 Tax=Racocetra fulgida TaxID=60492 RepID=A0A9N8VWZ8_9GLOM|nr:12694_t:CDS:2 [Racocetra fulgida]CAG8465418.1 12695_t:CDS:2 [Racocetra fulgida]
MTPYQFSRGLTYDAPVPPFLRGLTQPNKETNLEQEDDDNESSDEIDEINANKEDERPQIVVLKEGKHLSEQEVKKILASKEKDKKKEEEEIQEDSPAFDEKTGKLLFRHPKKKDIAKQTTDNKLDTVVGSSKTKTSKSDTSIKAVNEVIDGMKRKRDNKKDSKKEIDTSVSTDKKPRPKKTKKTHLSFDEEVDLVIAADTIVVYDGEILEKPKDKKDALNMLRKLNGNSHCVYTGIALVYPKNESDYAISTLIENTEVVFRNNSDDDFLAYIDTGEPLDKAGI